MRDTADTMRQTKRAITIAGLLTGCEAALGAVALAFAVQALGVIAIAGTTTALLPLVGLLAVVVAFIAAIDLCIDRTLLRAGLWIDHVLEPRLLRAGLAETTPSAALLDTNRALGELRDFIVSRNLRSLLMLPWVLLGAASLLVVEPRVGGLTLAVAATVIAAAIVSARLLRPSFVAQSEAARVVRRGVVVVTANAENLIGLGLAAHACDIEASRNRTWIAAAFAHGRRLTVAGVTVRGVLAAGQIAVIVVTANLMLSGAIDKLTGITIVALGVLVLAALFELPAHLLRLGAARAAWLRLHDVSLSDAADKVFTDGRSGATAATAANRADRRGVTALRRPLELRDVDFTYPHAATPTVASVSVTVAPGSALVVTGGPGSGKSTLAALLAGGLSPTSGLALLGHHTVRQRQGSTSRPDVGWLMQDPILMRGTVAENILRFTDASPDAAVEAARKAGVLGVLQTLPRGFDTDVGDDGRKLSMRQRRAIALARALANDPSFIVLDEPETMMDDVAVDELAATLAALMANGCGLVLVTRHPALAALATHDVLIVDGVLHARVIRGSWLAAPANDAAGDDAAHTAEIADERSSLVLARAG